LKVPKGKFVCIIGKTGSGKSSLLQALCGEMLTMPQKLVDHYKKDEGLERVLDLDEAQALMDDLIKNASTKIDYEVNGSIAYTAQSPWIRNKKIR
jgi:ABC-type cobalamin/Fe3+-siderophores transport system ATPase subunit